SASCVIAWSRKSWCTSRERLCFRLSDTRRNPSGVYEGRPQCTGRDCGGSGCCTNPYGDYFFANGRGKNNLPFLVVSWVRCRPVDRVLAAWLRSPFCSHSHRL
ncbi:unnamed protein product, partial [Ectocarpus sp. 12 AP-2014]